MVSRLEDISLHVWPLLRIRIGFHRNTSLILLIQSMPHPTVVVLCYALISLVDYAHKEANANLLGKNPDPGLLEMISTDRQVSATTSPAFIWTTKADKMLSYRHSELFAEACEQFGVDHELLEFETGDHGLGLTRKSSRSF